jgi:hypothetical protein
MATSGTVGGTTINTDVLIGHAIRRCGIPTGNITAEMSEIAMNNLYFYLTNLGNHGVNLWTIDRNLIGLTAFKRSLDLPSGTIDVLNATIRSLTRLSGGTGATSAGGTASYAFDSDLNTSCAHTSADGNISYDNGSAVTVTTIGIMTNGTMTLAPVFEYSSDGITWTTLYTPTAGTFTDSVWAWYDLPAPKNAQMYRVRETGGGTLALREFYLGHTPTELPMSRLNIDDWSALPNKSTTGKPLQFWVDRQLNYPVMNVWPVPDTTFQFYQVVATRHRHIQDIGTLLNTIEVPQRWHHAIVCNLAAALSIELPGVDTNRAAMLDQMAQRATKEAEDEERDASPIYYVPGIAVYSR